MATARDVQNERSLAAQQVLTNSLILEEIFTWISTDLGGGVLSRCARVNKQWFQEAARVLWREWRDSGFWSSPITDLSRQMVPMRRQFYSNFIRCAHLLAGESDDLVEVIKSTFEDISFPNLETLYLVVPGTSIRQPYSVEVPVFDAPRLTSLYIDPHFDPDAECYVVFQGEWMVLFDLVTARFPNLEKIGFLDRARVGPGELQKLKDRLPRLKHLHAERVIEASYVDRPPFLSRVRSKEPYEPLPEPYRSMFE